MKSFNKRDIFIIVLVLAAAAVMWFVNVNSAKGKEPCAEIYLDGELADTIYLTEESDRTFSIPQIETVVFHVFEDGSICFEESDCPDKVCIKSGRLKHVGQSAACLPNNIVIKIVPRDNEAEAEVDFIG